MDLLGLIWDFVLHFDDYLIDIVSTYESWTYLIMFAIIFVETGIVIMPFLPGDALLFAAGSIAGLPDAPLNIWLCIFLFITAAILGDTLNYQIGKRIGAKAFDGRYKLLRRSHLEKTEEFFEKYGGRAIIIARFVPIVRTVAPFVAGVGTMKYQSFLLYNVVGAIVWVLTFTLVGYFVGQIPFVQENFHSIIPIMFVLSIVPVIGERWYDARKSREIASSK